MAPDHLCPQVGVGEPLPLRRPVNQLTVHSGEGRAARCQIVDGFQDGRLALRVAAHQEDRPVGPFYLHADVVAEVFQAEGTDSHGV